MVTLELLSKVNLDAVRAIRREDIPESWVDNADTLWELTRYGIDHNCIGHTYAVKYGDAYIGVILLGEAIPWETDPEEMKAEPFYRLMGFVLDNRCRSQGIGGKVLEMVIDTIYEEYGVRPIALGVHKENHGAARFYERHGFIGVDAMEGNDRYYIRYPKEGKMYLQYKDLTIRDAVSSDAAQLTAWWNDGAVMAHAGFPNGLGTTEENVIAGLGNGRLILEENERLIGEACYREADEGVAEIGIKICETDCQNRGLGRIILSMLIAWLFDNGFQKIVLDTNLTNLRAQHVYESLGFRKLRINYDSWTDQLGNKQSAVDYELTKDVFIDFRK